LQNTESERDFKLGLVINPNSFFYFIGAANVILKIIELKRIINSYRICN